jgi:hypothetical protein
MGKAIIMVDVKPSSAEVSTPDLISLKVSTE